MEILKLSQEKREVGDRRLEVEDKYNSDIILLKGINPGKVHIMTEILEEEYKEKNVKSDHKSLYVVEPFGIYPSEPIYILPSNVFYFNAEILDLSTKYHQHKFVLPIHRKFYQWSVVDQSCGIIKNFGQFESGSNICTTKVVLEDNRLDYLNSTSNNIHVVHPTAIDIQLMELTNEEAVLLFSRGYTEDLLISNFNSFEIQNSHRYDISNVWKLVENRKYLIKSVLMYEMHQIRYTKHGIIFNLVADELIFYVDDILCFHGKEVCLISTKKFSDDFLRFGSSVNSGYGVDKNYQVYKNVKIFPQLKIEKFGMKEFSLPFLGFYEPNEYPPFKLNETSLVPNDMIKSQELRLIVNGGTGKYLFNTENSDVIQISEESLYGKNLGKTRVKVTDAEIPSNFDTVNIEVREVKDFSYLEERQEIELGSEFFINTIGLKSVNPEYDVSKFNFFKENTFTNCTNLNINTNLSQKDKSILRRSRISDESGESKISNYDEVYEFLAENSYLTKEIQKLLKLEGNSDNDESLRYLKYINYGVCNSKGFVSNNEGMIKISMNAQYFTKKSTGGTSPTRVVSSNNSKIFVFSPMAMISPKFDDIFTKELLAKGNVVDPNKFKNYIVAVGSGLSIQFTGGIIPWIEKKNDYSENIYLIDAGRNRTASVDIIKDKIRISPSNLNNKRVYFECVKENSEFEYVMNVSNRQDKTLLRPGKSVFNFSVGCYYPKYLSLFILNVDSQHLQNNLSFKTLPNSQLMREDQLNEVFSVPQKGGLEYFEKKNNIEIVRVYAFDDNKRIFVNVTSIQGEWSQRDLSGSEKFFKMLNEKEYEIYIRTTTGNEKFSLYPSNLNSEYFYSYILFENIVGKFDLIYTSKNKESNFVTINLIDYPSLTPANSTLYLTANNSLELTVLNGSGNFEISSSDDSLATYSYSEVDRKIKIVPAKQGILYLYLKDNKINNNYLSIATVYISDVKSIQLHGGGLLMTNSTMQIGLKVYDYFDNVFDFSQLCKMNLVIGDYAHISKGVEIQFDKFLKQKKQGQAELNSFPIKGLVAEVYTLYVIDSKSTIVSNSLRVEVFDKLQVFPPYLLMVPGSSYTLSVKGGPINEEHIVKRFEMLNTQVATVSDNSPEVKAHLVGKTVLRIIMEFKPDYYKIYRSLSEKNENSLVLSVDEVMVTVDFPDSVGIIGATNRKIYTKSTIRLMAALKLKDNVFTYGVGPLNFDWSLDNTLVAKLRFYKSTKEECGKDYSSDKTCRSLKNSNTQHVVSYRNVKPENSLGVFLSTSSQGLIEVKLTVKINYPDPYVGKKPNTFVTYQKVMIQDEIYVDIPEFYENIPNKSGLYLIPLDVDHQLQTNKNNNIVKYSLLSETGLEPKESKEKEQFLTLYENGKITSFHQRGLAHILINQKEKDNMPFIPVVLPVFVTEFHSLFLDKSYQLIDMEIGQVVKLKVIMQHEYGILFAEGKYERLKLKAVESHPKVATAELVDSNSHVSIRGLSKGETNIILFHPDTLKIYDVFQITVYSSLILPEKINLNIGGTINFLKKDENRKLYLSQDSIWVSENPQVLKIDPIEGIAFGLAEGITKVHLVSKDGSKFKLTTKVEVSRVKKIDLDRTKIPKYLTDIKDSPYFRAEYRISVNIYTDESSNEELSLDINDNLNEINQKLNLKCVSNQPEMFLAETDPNTLNSKIKECIIKIRDIPFDVEPPSNLELKISVEVQGERAQETYTFRTTALIPFMSAFKIKNKIKEITFSNQNRTNYVHVNNMNDLEVYCEDPSLVVLEQYSEDGQGHVKIYVPYSVTTSFNDVKLYLKNKQTDQKEEILLNYSLGKEEPQRIFFGLIRRDSLIDFITLIVLIIIIVILYNYLTSSDQVKIYILNI